MPNAYDTDVVIAGAGAAGLACALAAAERGASVTVIEASETYRTGSNTAMSTSMVPAGGSRWQEELDIDDSPQRFTEDVMRKTDGSADPVVTRALTSVAPELVAWMADECAVPLGLVTDFRYPGHSRDRCHAVPDRSGRTLHASLLDAVAQSSGIDVIVPMRLTAVGSDANGVTSCTVMTPNGADETIRTAAVVLATNGFGANRRLVERYMPEISDGLYFGGDRSSGDALEIGASLGADTGYLDAYQGHASVATPHGILVTWATIMHGGVLVNSAGERFGDETIGYSEYAVPVLEQPDGVAWLVFDRRIGELCLPFRDYRDLIENSAIYTADSTVALADRIGCDSSTLSETLESVAGSVAGVASDAFGRTAWESQLEAPYLVVKVTGALFHTQGGLKVDAHAQVLRNDEPIRGLYAAGGSAVGMSGRGASGYIAGNGLLAALGLGYLAGRHVTR